MAVAHLVRDWVRVRVRARARVRVRVRLRVRVRATCSLVAEMPAVATTPMIEDSPSAASVTAWRLTLPPG